MSLQGKIRGFGKYSSAMLEKMRTDLGLSLSIPSLSRCAAYYRTRERRDPLIEELRMLDRFAAVCRTAVGLTELYTNDACVARTYADMIAKRRALRPDASAPMTLDEAFVLADRALMRAGKSPTLRGHGMELCRMSANGNRAYTLREAGSDICLTLSSRPEVPATAGDLLVLLRPNATVIGQGSDPVSDFLSKDATRAMIKQSFTVEQGGLLSILLTRTNGAQIDLTRLSLTGETVPVSMLVDAYMGDRVILLARAQYEAFAQATIAHAIRPQAFASLNDSTRLAFFYTHNLPAFAFDSAFLRSLIPFRTLSVALGNECDAKDAPISHHPMGAEHSTYLRDDISRKAETLAREGLLFASASSSDVASYRNAIDTALAPILALAAGGTDYSAARLVTALTLPEDPSNQTFSEAISTVLGLYRVQTELGIPAVASHIFHDQNSSGVNLTVSAAAPEKPALPSVFKTENNGVYCLAPMLGADGQIDFGALREMLTYLSALAGEGAIKSVHLICRETLTSALQAMRTDAFSCRITDDIWVCEDALPLALLIEADREIRARRVGVVTLRKDTVAHTVETKLPDRRCLLPVAPSTATLIATRTDTNAHALAAELERRGAEVRLHTPRCDSTELARAILSSATLILCGNVSLPENDVISFAARTHTQAGGLVILLGDAKSGIFEDAIALPNGLSEDNLEKICKK